jgi:tRNA dimethylallyltransferase
VRELVKRNTRRYAKRQRTWFRREPDVVWIDAGAGRAAVVERIVALWRGAGIEAQ